MAPFGRFDETRLGRHRRRRLLGQLPGVIHYDVLRDDPRMRDLLESVANHDLLRLFDGGLVDNVPVRTAWQHVQRTGLAGGSRNAFIFALDGFAPRL